MPSRAAGSSFLTYSFGTRTAIQGPISFSAVQHTVYSLLSTADFLSNLFLAVTHLFSPWIITADFAFSLFPLSHILFSVIFSSGFYINSYSRCHFLSGMCQIYDLLLFKTCQTSRCGSKQIYNLR